MNVSVKVFASLKDICGFSEKSFPISNNTTINDIIIKLSNHHPDISDIVLLTAVNGEYMPKETVIKNNDIIAIFPPVSGG